MILPLRGARPSMALILKNGLCRLPILIILNFTAILYFLSFCVYD
jgi:hypothetical protein